MFAVDDISSGTEDIALFGNDIATEVVKVTLFQRLVETVNGIKSGQTREGEAVGTDTNDRTMFRM